MSKRAHVERTLHDEMASMDIDAVIGISPENVQHLTGAFIISQRMIPDRLAFAVYPRRGAPFFVVSTVVEYTARMQGWIGDVVPYVEHAERPIQGLIRALGVHGVQRGRVWVETGYLPVRDADVLRTALPDLEILDAERVLDRSRMIKTPEEIALMTRHARTWETAVRDAYAATTVGATERSIAARMVHNLLAGGADWVPFVSFASGPERTLIGHSVPDDTPVTRGQIMRLDMVGFFRGYYADFGRMAVVGDPSPAQRDAYRRTVTLQREIISRARPGVRASDLYRDSVAIGAELGMTFEMDAIGHSLGLRLHEYPILNRFEQEALAADMVMCVEIAHAFEGLGRFHVEDLIRVTDRGGERLTTLIDASEPLVVGR